MDRSHKIKRLRFTGAQNRVGMVYDILKTVSNLGINVLNIEVNPPHIYFKVQWPSDLSWATLTRQLKSHVVDIGEIIEVDIMEYEKKETTLDVIGDNISEGIIVVDQSGTVTYFSKKARDMLGIPEKGQPNLEGIFKSRDFEPALSLDEDRDNIEVTVTWQGKSTRVLTSVR
ncbi:MAG TPA: PAS domain-containing protein, partial [Bacillota bacterium]|nr:PAS domain-containing protein [Bacillota bacterium]